MFLSKLSNFYKRFEKYISIVGLIYGFIFTSLTLTRVDTFWENFWIVLHLIIATVAIFVLTIYEKKVDLHFYLTLAIQFAFGGLFSTFFVFYMRSSSLVDSWLFLFFLLVLVIGNELWKKQYQRLTFQVSIIFISFYLFLIFLLPVLFHRLGSDLFIASGILSLIGSAIFLYFLRKIAIEKFSKSHNWIRFSVISIFIIMNILYFTNIIPPIPLSIKNSGVYHTITRTADGNYEVKAEKTRWQDYFNFYPVFHRRAGEPIYAFSAIFSPINFQTEVIHQWQYYDKEKKEWIDSNRISLSIVGGREGGFRTYSVKQAVPPGRWRVRVLAPDGKAIGNINFEVKEISDKVDLWTNLI